MRLLPVATPEIVPGRRHWISRAGGMSGRSTRRHRSAGRRAGSCSAQVRDTCTTFTGTERPWRDPPFPSRLNLVAAVPCNGCRLIRTDIRKRRTPSGGPRPGILASAASTIPARLIGSAAQLTAIPQRRITKWRWLGASLSRTGPPSSSEPRALAISPSRRYLYLLPPHHLRSLV